MGVWEKQWQVQWIDWWNSSCRVNWYLSLFLSDTHLQLEFHQSIHCTCHCFSQTPIYDWSFTSQFTVPVIVSLRHPSTTGVSPENPSTMDTSQQWIDWWNSSCGSPVSDWEPIYDGVSPVNSELTGETPVVDVSPASDCFSQNPLRWTPVNSELTGETPVVDGCLTSQFTESLFLSDTHDTSQQWIDWWNSSRRSRCLIENPSNGHQSTVNWLVKLQL